MSFLRVTKACFTLSLLLTIVSLGLLVWPGARLGIEFTGGTLLEMEIPNNVTGEQLTTILQETKNLSSELGNINSTKTHAGTFLIRLRALTNEEHAALLKHMSDTVGKVHELQFTTIGPTVGASLRVRATWALIFAAGAIIMYLAFAFRKVPKRFNPWSFGISAVLAVLHDILITLGIFTILSHTTSFEIDLLFISAILSIMGYSVSDTIVIFDRIRDNLSISGQREDFAKIAERSLRQSLARTLNTGLGAIMMLFALFIFGAGSIRWFILTLIIGTIIGTYSSFFVATPLLIYWKKREKK